MKVNHICLAVVHTRLGMVGLGPPVTYIFQWDTEKVPNWGKTCGRGTLSPSSTHSLAGRAGYLDTDDRMPRCGHG